MNQSTHGVSGWRLLATLAATAALAACNEGSDSKVTTDALTAVGVPSGSLVLVGAPPTEVTSGVSYFFQPYAMNANGAVSFSIQGKPEWMQFDASTGVLSGTPAAGDIGSSADIAVVATTANASGSIGPFKVLVKNADFAAPSLPNTSPVISGTAPSTIVANQSYSFAPTTFDAEGAALSFSVANRPSWATFNTATGQLSGTPTAASVGMQSDILIRVSDGFVTVALPAFSINVTQPSETTSPPTNTTPATSGSGSALVSWSPPLQNTDGSMLTDLTGFNIYYGKDPNNLTLTVQLDCGGCLWHNLTNLDSGTWYFAVKSYNRLGTESGFSTIESKTIS
jgi:Putative Ig domain